MSFCAAWRATVMLALLLLAGCQTTGQQPVSNEGLEASAALERCVNLVRKVRVWCRNHGAAVQNRSSFGGPTSLDCMDARLELESQCASQFKP